MDALKKAELAKRKAQPDNAAAAAVQPTPHQPALPDDTENSSAATPHSPLTFAQGDPAPASLPPLSDHLELLDHQFDIAPPIAVASKPEIAKADTAVGNSTLSLQSLDVPVSHGTSAKADTPPATTVERDTVQNLFEA